MKKVFVIERSADVFNTVKHYLKEENLPYISFQNVREALVSPDLPALIVLFGNDSFQAIREDIANLKDNPLFVKIPKVLILPFNAAITPGECKSLDVQESFFIPVEKLKFQTAVSKFLLRSPRRVFRILVNVQQDGSNLRYSGISMDFSESGMAFECVSDFPIGEKLMVSFVNPKNRNRFSLKSEIVRRTSTPTGSSVFYGVMFMQMSEKDIQDITQFISGGA
ncbi:MAG: PilZ domain-containing protein [Nitrospirota bacterium]|nr:PilZ domain-containing protein [Nitrospirota bacterium]